MFRNRFVFRVFECALACSAALAHSADLTLEFTGMQVTKGSVAVKLFDSAEAYPEQSVQAVRVPADKSQVEIVFKDLKPGIYAISAYHDVNDNKVLDVGLFGVPKEPYGFSRNARGNMGPPTFREVRFEVSAAGARMPITLQ